LIIRIYWFVFPWPTTISDPRQSRGDGEGSWKETLPVIGDQLIPSYATGAGDIDRKNPYRPFQGSVEPLQFSPAKPVAHEGSYWREINTFRQNESLVR
jgi:hypothetical protein